MRGPFKNQDSQQDGGCSELGSLHVYHVYHYYYYCYYYYYYYDDDDDYDGHYDGRSLGFCPRSHLEDIRKCKKRGRRGLSWTSAKKTLSKTVAPRGGSLRRTAPAWGLAQFGRQVFCPRRPVEARKLWQARTFAAAELAPRLTLKSYWVPKP